MCDSLCHIFSHFWPPTYFGTLACLPLTLIHVDIRLVVLHCLIFKTGPVLHCDHSLMVVRNTAIDLLLICFDKVFLASFGHKEPELKTVTLEKARGSQIVPHILVEAPSFYSHSAISTKQFTSL